MLLKSAAGIGLAENIADRPETSLNKLFQINEKSGG